MASGGDVFAPDLRDLSDLERKALEVAEETGYEHRLRARAKARAERLKQAQEVGSTEVFGSVPDFLKKVLGSSKDGGPVTTQGAADLLAQGLEDGVAPPGLSTVPDLLEDIRESMALIQDRAWMQMPKASYDPQRPAVMPVPGAGELCSTRYGYCRTIPMILSDIANHLKNVANVPARSEMLRSAGFTDGSEAAVEAAAAGPSAYYGRGAPAGRGAWQPGPYAPRPPFGGRGFGERNGRGFGDRYGRGAYGDGAALPQPNARATDAVVREGAASTTLNEYYYNDDDDDGDESSDDQRGRVGGGNDKDPCSDSECDGDTGSRGDQSGGAGRVLSPAAYPGPAPDDRLLPAPARPLDDPDAVHVVCVNNGGGLPRR